MEIFLGADLEGIQKGDVFIQNLVIQLVFDVSSFFFCNDDLHVGKNFQMMANGRLREVDDVSQVDAIQTITLFFDLLYYKESVGVGQRLCYFLGFLCVHKILRLAKLTFYLFK